MASGGGRRGKVIARRCTANVNSIMAATGVHFLRSTLRRGDGVEDASRTASRAGCTHNYFQPAPCRDDVSWWACVGNGDDGTEHLEQELQTWYENTGGKPIWVTEFACNPWAERICNESLHARLMEQVVPVLEASPRVFRYAWFATVWKSNYGRPTPSRAPHAIDAMLAP